MRKIYYLSTCDTCKRILKSLNLNGVSLTDIKFENISAEILDEAAKITGSYESLFNKRAQKLKSMGPNEKPVTEADFRSLILSDYTFLKRPLALIDGKVFAGNDKETIENLTDTLIA